jgi:hypothetical protein
MLNRSRPPPTPSYMLAHAPPLPRPLLPRAATARHQRVRGESRPLLPAGRLLQHPRRPHLHLQGRLHRRRRQLHRCGRRARAALSRAALILQRRLHSWRGGLHPSRRPAHPTSPTSSSRAHARARAPCLQLARDPPSPPTPPAPPLSLPHQTLSRPPSPSPAPERSSSRRPPTAAWQRRPSRRWQSTTTSKLRRWGGGSFPTRRARARALASRLRRAPPPAAAAASRRGSAALAPAGTDGATPRPTLPAGDRRVHGVPRRRHRPHRRNRLRRRPPAHRHRLPLRPDRGDLPRHRRRRAQEQARGLYHSGQLPQRLQLEGRRLQE